MNTRKRDNQPSRRCRTIPVALVQFDAVPEKPARNLKEMERLVKQAVRGGARWIMFHEATVTDYTPRVESLAEQVPDGRSTRRMAALARRLDCWISFGLSEKNGERYHISQVFAGPECFVYCYRKTWLFHAESGNDHRDEWAWYDPGSGPEAFVFDGVRATCFICADGSSRRCIRRAGMLKPQVVFYPNNRSDPISIEELSGYAKLLGVPILVTNRVGRSWIHDCKGGCAVVSGKGKLCARADTAGHEDILHYSLEISDQDVPPC